jgi:hypothetical protein
LQAWRRLNCALTYFRRRSVQRAFSAFRLRAEYLRNRRMLLSAADGHFAVVTRCKVLRKWATFAANSYRNRQVVDLAASYCRGVKLRQAVRWWRALALLRALFSVLEARALDHCWLTIGKKYFVAWKSVTFAVQSRRATHLVRC